MKLPPTLVRNLHDIHDDAAPWLADLDDHIRACETRWNIRVGVPFPNLSYHVVAPATGADGAPYVLKLSLPNDELSLEAAALEFYDGDGMVKLIAHAPEVQALLLERLFPGISLWPKNNMADGDEATRIAATLLQRLWRPVPEEHPFRPLQSWTRALPKYLEAHPQDNGPLPHALVDRANGLLNDLLPTSEPVLLHADLHHDNILTASREPYLAIDPKGIVGSRGYDVGTFLMNPTPELAKRPDLGRILKRRVNIFGEMLNMNPQEVAAWGLIHAVLSACWYAEDNGEISDGRGKEDLAVAETLFPLL